MFSFIHKTRAPPPSYTSVFHTRQLITLCQSQTKVGICNTIKILVSQGLINDGALYPHITSPEGRLRHLEVTDRP